MIDAFNILAAATPSAEGGIAGVVHEFGIEWPFLIAQIISFSVVAFLLYKFAFKPVLATIDERQTKIEAGLNYTEEMKVKLADAETQHTARIKEASLEAQQIIHEARETGKEMIEQQIQEATDRAEQTIAKAGQAIELERKKMLADVREEIARLVVLTTSRVLSRDLSDDERSRYVSSATEELDRN
ncbi:MAG: ATP synthase F0 subunit B [Verrucomicrobia bacterium]|nr:MAG: ATP synthase F0 subunit B [Verrucomicrobiota bacterium]